MIWWWVLAAYLAGIPLAWAYYARTQHGQHKVGESAGGVFNFIAAVMWPWMLLAGLVGHTPNHVIMALLAAGVIVTLLVVGAMSAGASS